MAPWLDLGRVSILMDCRRRALAVGWWDWWRGRICGCGYGYGEDNILLDLGYFIEGHPDHRIQSNPI